MKDDEGNFRPISPQDETIGKALVNAAYIVHKEPGPGLLEKVYELCFYHVVARNGFTAVRKTDIPIVFDGIVFSKGLRLDVMVNDLVICKLKALKTLNPVWKTQILSHLKLTGKRLGYRINFNVSLIKDGITRIVH